MDIIETHLAGVVIIIPDHFGDERGFFKETYQQSRYERAGIIGPFVQDNFSRSQRNVLRGLHFQKKRPQGKLVTCISGSVFDVAVDIDPDSKTFGEYVGVELSGKNHKQLWIPAGYAHGFGVISDVADFQYKCTDYYDPTDEAGIVWNDRHLAIDWPIKSPIVSQKDGMLPTLDSLVHQGLINSI